MISDHEIVEVCPHCGFENIYAEGCWFATPYKAFCKECEKEIFLCDECMHSEDNPTMTCLSCDWREENGCEICMRGRIRNV